MACDLVPLVCTVNHNDWSIMYGVAKDYEYSATHKRERLTLWSGAFMSEYEGEAYSRPKGNGYIITRYTGERLPVWCPVGFTDENYDEIVKALRNALEIHDWVKTL